MTALFRPQPRRLDLGEPIDDVAQHAEQQGLEHPNRRREHGHGGDVAPRTPGTGPQEREEAVRQRRRRRIRIGRDEFLEILEQDSWAPAAAAILESYRLPNLIALQDGCHRIEAGNRPPQVYTPPPTRESLSRRLTCKSRPIRRSDPTWPTL